MDLSQIRNDFPILTRKIYDRPLVYLDNAATSLKPNPVIEAISTYYAHETANVHRGIHHLSTVCTEKYESVRKTVAQFINAPSENNIVFTRGTTEAINLVAFSYARTQLSAGDRIICTELEHHSNMVPWQMLAKEKNLDLVYIPILEDGSLDMLTAEELFTPETKLLTFNYVSNSLGTINSVKDLTAMAKRCGAVVSLDAAQAVMHFTIDVQALDIDFMSFSSHKLLGPTGVGVLYAKVEHLEVMPPLFGGGDMIEDVSLTGSTWNHIPHRFEAGTPHIAGVIGFGAAIDYLKQVGFAFIEKQERDLFEYASEQLLSVEGIKIFGTSKNKVPIFSFSLGELHGSDIATILDQEGVAIRSGHHCTMPVLKKYKVNSLARASFAFYNSKEEVDVFIKALKKAKDFLL